MCCGMLNNIPGLYPLDASSSPPSPVMTTQNVSRHCQVSIPRRAELSPIENHWPRRTFSVLVLSSPELPAIFKKSFQGSLE